MARTRPFHFTGDPEADALIARDPLALLIGFALDQQITVQTTRSPGPLKLRQRLGTLDPAAIAATDPARLEEAFREKPAIHRFPGAMAKRVQDLCAFVETEYDGDASRLWIEARDAKDLERRIRALPGFGDMKVKALSAVLAKRLGVEVARPLAPDYPTLGDVDSVEALEAYQAAKRAYRSARRGKVTKASFSRPDPRTSRPGSAALGDEASVSGERVQCRLPGIPPLSPSAWARDAAEHYVCLGAVPAALRAADAPARVQVDPITFAVIGGALFAICGRNGPDAP